MTTTAIYVGNVPFGSTEADLRQLFEAHGIVRTVHLPVDRDTGRPRGFAFVEMAPDDARAAIRTLNETKLAGRALRVNEARPRGAPTPHAATAFADR